MKRMSASSLVFTICMLLSCIAHSSFAGAYKVYSTYLWHLQQPIYWPEKVQGQDRYQFAQDSLSGSPNYPGHPLNNLSDIFGKDDRVAIYQYRSRDSVASMNQPDAGAQLSYSGCLIENISSLGNSYNLGYSPSWNSGIREAMQWTTTRGKRKLEPVGFTYHHSLAPLIDPEALEMEIAINKDIWWKAWLGYDYTEDQPHPKGFRCAEETFSTRIIDDLVKAGYEWVIVPNHHLSRTHPNYRQLHGKGLYDAPNKADQINPPNNGGWYSGEIDGRGSTESIPFSFQAHWAKHVDPETGQEYKIIVVPMTDLGSYRDGYSQQGIDILHTLNSYANHDQPCIALFSHDGDNAWGGGFSYYGQAVPSFVGQAAGAGYRPTTIQTFLDENPPPENDVVHVEDGSWFNAADDWGHPQYWNWLWPPQRDRTSPEFDWNDPSTWADIENGWAEDFRNWAVIMGAQNYVSTARQIWEDNGQRFDSWRVQDPTQGANDAELAWHFFLPSLTSGYMYYGSAIDMEVKQTLACNEALPYARNVFATYNLVAHDATGPTVFIPQRYPYNPGTTNYGSAYGYRSWVNSNGWYIWTFAADVSDVTSVVLKIRQDLDGFNPINNNDNETYAGGASVGSWTDFAMNKRDASAFEGNIFNSPEIDFFIMPDDGTGQSYVADQYWYKLTGYENVLLDYYVEAYDSKGNVTKTEIQHVYVGSEGGSAPVTVSPAVPEDCEDVVIRYNAESRSLSGAGAVTLAITYDGWATTSLVAMSSYGVDKWVATNGVSDGATTGLFYFVNGGTVDNQDGANWSFDIAPCSFQEPSAVTFSPASPTGCVDLTITYLPNEGALSSATNVFIHVGVDGWKQVVTPDPLMTDSGTGSWSYVYSIPRGAGEVNVAVNNGSGLWDNNGGEDWNLNVQGCEEPVTFVPQTPEDCDEVSITYDPLFGVLSGADTVLVHITWVSVSTPPAVEMELTNGVWAYATNVPVGVRGMEVYFSDGAGTFDGDTQPWELSISACSTSGVAPYINTSPEQPNGCEDVTITYVPGTGPLKDASEIYIHVGHDAWQDVITPNPLMTDSGTGSWSYVYQLHPGTEEINVAFNDGATWDNNNGDDWAVIVSNCSQIVSQQITMVEGSPFITDDPGDQNDAADAFDFNRSGGGAVSTDQGGFGSFGSVYFNYDASNLYVGATGVNVGGSNNALVLFLGLNTLSDDADNLWNQSGLPNGLDYLHNIWLQPAMDIAIVVGDEYGDGTYSNFNLGSGYDFGQGLYYISSSGSFVPVGGARLSQYDGSGTNVTGSVDADGNRLTDRWEAALPWTSLNAVGAGDITNLYFSGLIVNSSVTNNDRYISGNYLGLSATNNASRDEFNNFGFSFVTLTALEVTLMSSDSDGDGLPDEWEVRYFGGTTNGVPGLDSDGDGFSNEEEYRLGTHPVSDLSTFIFDRVVSTGSYPVISWTTVGGKSYSIGYNDNLMATNGFSWVTTVTETDVADGVNSEHTFTDMYTLTPVPSNGFRTYRVRLQE